MVSKFKFDSPIVEAVEPGDETELAKLVRTFCRKNRISVGRAEIMLVMIAGQLLGKEPTDEFDLKMQLRNLRRIMGIEARYEFHQRASRRNRKMKRVKLGS
jgi:hypothetical protein